LRRSEDKSGAEGGSLASRRLLGDMLGFWVSDAAFAMKRRLGMG